ncbi:MAG TPA: nucleotidyltransferase domain-containing protein [Gemmatimonadaceae bacterium]|nr:nucleotidyltransferase domain-containing protein [Gemmatimonadaceae bacterium]
MSKHHVPQVDRAAGTARSTHLILPAGTQVVSRVEVRDAGGVLVVPLGAAGVIVRAPDDATHSYRVRLPDGREVSLRRNELSIRKHVQADELDALGVLRDYDLYQHVIYRCIVGSHAYGLAGAQSDVDRRGIYLPPAELHWSLYGVPEQLEDRETDEVYWELRKFIVLALKANPNILECLYTPIVEHTSPVADALIEMRSRFLSKHLYQTYNGYVLSQFKRLEQDIRTTGTLKWKHAMHLIRLLIAGVTALREGYVPVHVGEHRERLLAIKRGETAWEEVNEWRLALHREFDAALASTHLPERPDYERANALLVWARRRAVEGADVSRGETAGGTTEGRTS